ncbi:MAG: ABC transporter substrate-binding protein [Burkholderiales bacterium]|uniref:ABC transporter substrate-binding protein n=1 Tax=Limnobacter sp. TaxID=2003368 RepID=UPI0039BC6D63|nr:ABC transporter substrate-binding protein [Burkholderiales bacterium]
MTNNTRRKLLLTGGATGLLAGLPMPGKQAWAADNNLRIGIVTFRGATDVEAGFVSYIRQAGLQAEFDHYDIARDLTRLPEIVAELKARDTKLVLTWGTSVTQGITGTYAPKTDLRPLPCPVVFALVTAPVVSGIVQSLTGCERPITGVFHVASLEQQMQAIQSYTPFKTIGMLYTPTENNSVVTKQLLHDLLNSQKKKLIALPIPVNAQGQAGTMDKLRYLITELLDELKQQRCEWLYLPPDSLVGSLAKELIIPAAHQRGLATFASTEQLMDAGSLIGLVCSYFEVGQFAGFKAMQILRGKQFAGQIPVETIKKYKLKINSNSARVLGKIPPLELFGVASFQ